MTAAEATPLGDFNVEAAAQRLWQARQRREPIAPLRDLLAADDLAGAYRVQSRNTRRQLAAGAHRVGRKIGLTSQAVQKQLGVDQPDFGTLFDDMLYEGPVANVPRSRFLQPRIEGEIAFVVAQDVLELGMAMDKLAAYAGTCAAAFEIVDSAFADWKITLADTVADNASCGAIVTGRERLPVYAPGLRLAGMVLSVDGKVASLGVGAASLGNPLLAFAWLADLALRLGDPIRAGEVVLTGALGPMIPFEAGRRYRLEIAGFSPLEVIAE